MTIYYCIRVHIKTVLLRTEKLFRVRVHCRALRSGRRDYRCNNRVLLYNNERRRNLRIRPKNRSNIYCARKTDIKKRIFSAGPSFPLDGPPTTGAEERIAFRL